MLLIHIIIMHSSPSSSIITIHYLLQCSLPTITDVTITITITITHNYNKLKRTSHQDIIKFHSSSSDQIDHDEINFDTDFSRYSIAMLNSDAKISAIWGSRNSIVYSRLELFRAVYSWLKLLSSLASVKIH